MADFRKWLYAFAVVALLAGFTIPAALKAPPSLATTVAVHANRSLGRVNGVDGRPGSELHGW